MNQFLEFMKNKMIPEAEKHFQGVMLGAPHYTISSRKELPGIRNS